MVEMTDYEKLFSKDSVSRFDLADAISNLGEKYDHFLLNCVMRIGKSIQATGLINKWNSQKILILTGAESTNNQWKENLEKYNPHLLDKCDIYCYHSLHKIENIYDTILLDEFDTATTDKRMDHIENLQPKHWIAMSGTLESEDIDLFRQLTNNKFFQVQVDLEQGVKWGILPEPKVYVTALTMDDTKRYLLYKKGKDKNKKDQIVPFNERWDSIKNKKVNTLVQCTEIEYHQLLCEDFERWKSYEYEFNLPFNERSQTVRFLQSKGFTQSVCRDNKLRIGNERKKFFAEIKNRHFKKLFSQLPENSRVVVFCNDTKQADLLNEEFAVHSLKPGSLELVEKFNNKEIPYLFSVGQIARGVDLYHVDYLVIIQTSMKQATQAQKIGRSLLSVAPKIILFYYPGTQDEEYIKEFLKQINPDWIVRKKI